MITQLHHFYQFSIYTRSRNMESAFFKFLSKVVIKFISMTMSFRTLRFSIQTKCQTIWIQLTVITSQSHRTSFGIHSSLMFHQMHHIMFSLRSKLLTTRILVAQNISRKFNRHNLRSQTHSQIRDFFCSRILCSQDHSFHSSTSKPSRNTNPIIFSQNFSDFFHLLFF